MKTVRFGDVSKGASTPQRTKFFDNKRPPMVISPHVGYQHGIPEQSFDSNTLLLSELLPVDQIGKILYSLAFFSDEETVNDYAVIKQHEQELDAEEFFSEGNILKSNHKLLQTK